MMLTGRRRPRLRPHAAAHQVRSLRHRLWLRRGRLLPVSIMPVLEEHQRELAVGVIHHVPVQAWRLLSDTSC